MANTVVGFSINIDGINNINDLNKEIKATQKAMAELDTTTEEYSQQAQKLAKLTAEQKAVKKQQDDLNKSFLEGSNALGAYDKASAKLNRLRKEFKDLEISGQGASEGAQALAKEIIALDTQLKGVDAKVGQFNRNVGNYAGATKGFGARLSEFGEKASETSGALGGIGAPAGMAIKAFQGIGVAVRFALGPIGLIIAAIGLIVAAIRQFFTSSEEGQNAARQLGAVFSAVFGVISDVVSEVGKAIFAVLNGIGTAINFVVDRLGGANTRLSKVANEAVKISKLQDELDKRRRDSLVETATLESEIEELKTKSVNKEKFNVQERLKFIDDAIAREEQVMKIKEDLAKRNLEIIRRTNAQSKSNKDALDAEKQAEAELINVRTANAVKNKELIGQRIGFIDQIKAEEKALKDAQAESFKRSQEIIKEREAFQKANQEFIENAAKLNQSIIQKTEQLTTSFITDEYQKRRVEAQKAYNSEIAELEKSIEAQKKINAERFAETQKQFGKNSKQAIEFKKQTDAQELQAQDELDAFLTKRKIKLTDELLKIDKDQTNKLIEEQKKRFEVSAAALQRNATNEKNLLEKAYNEQITQYAGNKEKLEEINAQYQKDVLELEKKRLQDELALNEQKLKMGKDLTQDETNAILSANISLNTQLAKLEAERTKTAVAESGKREQNEKDKAAKRLAQLQKDLDVAQQYADLAFQTVAGLVQASDEARMKRLEKDAEANSQIQANLEERLQNATGLERRYLEQQLRAEKQNAEAIAKAQEQAEKDAAKKNKTISLIQSIINTALAITKQLAIGNTAGAILAGITGGAQTAVIAAQPLAKGGVVGKGEDIVQFANGGKVTNKGNIKPLSNGDNVLATLKTGEIVLNEAQQKRIGYNTLKAAKIPNFANGGFVGAPTSLISSANNTIATEQMRVNLMDEMVKATNERIDRLTVVYTATTDYEVEKSRTDKKNIKQNATF